MPATLLRAKPHAPKGAARPGRVARLEPALTDIEYRATDAEGTLRRLFFKGVWKL